MGVAVGSGGGLIVAGAVGVAVEVAGIVPPNAGEQAVSVKVYSTKIMQYFCIAYIPFG